MCANFEYLRINGPNNVMNVVVGGLRIQVGASSHVEFPENVVVAVLKLGSCRYTMTDEVSMNFRF